MAAHGDVIRTRSLGEGLFQLSDPFGYRAYLVVGEREAVLVDTMGGCGNLMATVRSLACARPVRVLLTHCHADHVGGAWAFPEVAMAAGEDGHWDEAAADLGELRMAAVRNGMVAPDEPWAFEVGMRPRVAHLADGDEIDLGGRRLTCVALPGHTDASMGYLCPELRALFSGDAVTPIMCLCFSESLPVAVWRRTLEKMGRLDFERFYTGHHDHAFTKADLAGFKAAADFVQAGDRGFAWHHAVVAGWEGTCHLCPCDTADADSPDFRAVITRGLPAPRRSRPGHRG